MPAAASRFSARGAASPRRQPYRHRRQKRRDPDPGRLCL